MWYSLFMEFHPKKHKKVSIYTPIVISTLTFIVSLFVAMNLVFNYIKLSEDKQYADMVTCSDFLSSQVYDRIMSTFSKGNSLAGVISARGDEVFSDSKMLDAIMKDSCISGFLYMMDGKIEGAYPQNIREENIGKNVTEDFSIRLPKGLFKDTEAPIIIGPYKVPGSDSKAISVLYTFYTPRRENGLFKGHLLIVADYNQLFGDIDISMLEEKNVLWRIWRDNAVTGNTQVLMESSRDMPEDFLDNCVTFQKSYFTTDFNFCFMPEKDVYQSSSFFLIAISAYLICVLIAGAMFFLIKNLNHINELKLFKVQTKLLEIQEHTIVSLSNLVENRDSETGSHVRRTSDYVYMIAKAAKKAGLYPEILTFSYVESLKNAAPLHDIGKIVISDAILKKPGRFTAEEFDQIKCHTVEGAKIIQNILGPVQTPEFVKMTMQIAEFHHEKWNGKGYPSGLSGEQIPLCARIMSLADVFDALTTPRCYKESYPFEVAIEMMRSEMGVSFDPELTKIMLANQDKLREIMQSYAED